MKHFVVVYKDSGGTTSNREISDIQDESTDGMINAFCHLRGGRRSFQIKNIISLVDKNTGEVVNPYSLLENKDRPSLDSLLFEIRPAIRALKFFTMTTRGFTERERRKIINFIKVTTKSMPYSDQELEEWLKNFWCGDLYVYRSGELKEYREILCDIPKSLLETCKNYALQIALGSGRKPINPEWEKRIQSEFSENPIVLPPKLEE